jgi:transcription-repair coupling factor (superfamily II helicase)
LIVITEEELFGEKKRRALPPRIKSGYFVSDFSELKVGDCLVHIDHGVGIYQGLQRLKVGDIFSDCLLIEYFGNDKLYVPVDRIKMVQKYIGTEGSVPKIDRLGGLAWKKTKKKVKTSMKAMAKELLAVYASRTLLQGFSFSPIDHYYREFEATFPYEETPDQLDTIEDVMRDMSAAKPMDRLICGDVGYGKTEVAVRASFRAAMDGKQVAILVPTTVLAQQHYQTMCERLKPYPIEVEMLSRFRSRAEQKNILRKLEEGTIDIIIGTHRLIQKDVHFNNVGLVIIDEEQRFGVAHKERFKKMRKVVDVLTLTATPIPRTLYMSVVGIRDMSLITTPPEDRLAIKTFINRFNAEVIKEAIVRELRRGGQVFFVHDRVHTIRAMARFLNELVPEAHLAIAHGQMSEKELEKVMVSFIMKEVNLLVSTTIIESGLDFPSANTIIINRADRMGLAQLYQLRGRVGRSKYRAYCYLLIPGESVLSKEAHDRLKAIFEFSELGSSLRLASRDLEIRGAGNILGTSQSGHIAAVGMDLYTQLMEETIKELQGEKLIPEIDPEVNLPIPSFIPEDYITAVSFL